MDFCKAAVDLRLYHFFLYKTYKYKQLMHLLLASILMTRRDLNKRFSFNSLSATGGQYEDQDQITIWMN